METSSSILEFWFGIDPDDGAAAVERAKLWWGKDADHDAAIRHRFEKDLLAAAAGQLMDWESQPRGRLALILLTDQFSRNIFRYSARAFAFDDYALAWALDGISDGMDQKLRPIERVFFYLPLEHAESLEHQNHSVELFSALAASVRDEWRATFSEYLNFAERHRAVIARFGRFPHRNQILRRQSTAEEVAFLTEPGSSF